jgi:hypothetical protein
MGIFDALAKNWILRSQFDFELVFDYASWTLMETFREDGRGCVLSEEGR